MLGIRRSPIFGLARKSTLLPRNSSPSTFASHFMEWIKLVYSVALVFLGQYRVSFGENNTATFPKYDFHTSKRRRHFRLRRNRSLFHIEKGLFWQGLIDDSEYIRFSGARPKDARLRSMEKWLMKKKLLPSEGLHIRLVSARQ